MPNITTADVYVDVQLTDVSVRYTNEAYIADTIFPIVNVKKKSGIYYTYDKSNLKRADDKRTSGGRANRVEYGLTKTAYGPLVEHSLEEGVDWEEIELAVDPLDPKIDAVNNISERLLINKEYALANYLATGGNLGSSVTLSGTDQFSDFANSDPFTKIETARLYVQKNALKQANTIIMGLDVWSKLKNHPDLIERCKYTNRKGLEPSDLSVLFPGIENVYVASAMENTAVEGQTAVMASIWGKHLWVAYITKTPGIRQVSLGYTLTLEGFRYTDAWTEQQVKQDFVRVNDYYEQKIVAKECIYGILNAVA